MGMAHQTQVSRRLLKALGVTLLGPLILAALPAVALSSESPRVVVERVQRLITQGNLTEAQTRLRQAIEKHPEVAGFYDLLGVVDAQQGNYKGAERSFKHAIQLDPRLLGAYLNLGHLYQEQMRSDQTAKRNAVETYEALLKVSPPSVEGNFQLGLLLEQDGKYRASLRHLERLPAAGRRRSRVLALFAADYVALNENAKAGTTLTELLSADDLSELDVIPLLSRLEAHRKQGMELRLLECLQERHLASLSTLQRLGFTYAQEGKLTEARRTLDQVAVRESKPVKALMELARIADQQKDYKGALGYLARARDLDPGNAAIHFLFGMTCVQDNLGAEAYKSLKRAVELKPDEPYYNYALGAVILNHEEPRAAIPYFKKYSQLKPNDPRGRLGVAVAYFYSHDLNSAARVLKSIEGFRQTAASTHFLLGRIAQLQGNLSLATQYLDLAIKEEPDYAAPYTILGLVYMNQKQYGPADKAFHEALKRTPNNYMANLNLLILYQRTHDARVKAQQEKVSTLRKDQDVMARRMLATIKIDR